MNCLEFLYESDLYNRIASANCLIVGVGGIGCELLKVLTSSGFKKFTILDFDTIEHTNLNRQFYFRKEHVGMSKALVGKECVQKKFDDLQIEAIHGSIFEARFDVQFFSKFDLVFCALDNQPARLQLSSMCIRSQRVMLDAGTGGYQGQTNIIRRFQTPCNACTPTKPGPQFAVCTIRANPTEPIHCLTFAMALYNLLFGQKDESNFLTGLLDINEIRDIPRDDVQSLKEHGIKIFNKLFYEEIKKGLEAYILGLKPEEKQLTVNQYKFPISFEEAIQNEKVYSKGPQEPSLPRRQILQPLKYYAYLFVHQFVKIMRSGKIGELKFDKDDWDSVKFVVCVANFRTYNFCRQFQNLDPKLTDKDKHEYLSIEAGRQMAGKIIPAIASTNSIAAALQTNDSRKVLKKNFKAARTQWISSGFEKVGPTFFGEPNEICDICSQRVVYLIYHVDYDVHTLEAVIQLASAFGVQNLDFNSSKGTIYGAQNLLLIKNQLNETNRTSLLKNFNEPENQYCGLTINVFEKNSERTYFWQLLIKYEFNLIHTPGIKTPLLSQHTKMEDAFNQLKALKISQLKNVRKQRQQWVEQMKVY